MDACDSVDLVVVAARSIVLIIAAAGGVLCIFLGWRLYKDAILSKTEGSAVLKQGKFKLAAAGPGVFFALFGMWLLVKLVDRPVQVGNSATSPQAELRGPTQFKRGGPHVPIYSTPYTWLNAAQPAISSRLEVTRIVQVDKDENKTSSNAKCLVKRTHVIVMFGGQNENITSTVARQALASASQALRREEENLRSNGFLDAAMEKRKEIEALDAMRTNVVE
ncbi:hypothetical protein [Paraburkholderia sp. RL17-347-BIC-D]|uniref:hypothetical protein n=1 Tax=Paraburkholderia sp. RL17-347-BIC-D TaxID=3031632 RepID=UPI0038B73BB0